MPIFEEICRIKLVEYVPVYEMKNCRIFNVPILGCIFFVLVDPEVFERLRLEPES